MSYDNNSENNIKRRQILDTAFLPDIDVCTNIFGVEGQTWNHDLIKVKEGDCENDNTLTKKKWTVSWQQL